MTGETIQWSDIGSTREAAADDAARRYDRVRQESPKTTDAYWSAHIENSSLAIAIS